MPIDYKVVTRTLVTRAWTEIEPKLVTSLVSGSATAGLLTILEAYGVNLPAYVIAMLPILAVAIAGYLKKSVVTIPVELEPDDPESTEETVEPEPEVSIPEDETYEPTVDPFAEQKEILHY